MAANERGFGRFELRLWNNIKGALWILVPAIAGEAVQHAAEFRFGMYVRHDGIAAGFETQVRGITISIKVFGFLATLLLARRRFVREPIDRPTLPTAFAAISLPIVLHYALNYLAVGKPDPVVSIMIAIDTLVIGWLAASLAAALQKTDR